MGIIFYNADYKARPNGQKNLAKAAGVAMLGTAVVLADHEHVDVEQYAPEAPASNYLVVTSTGANTSFPSFVHSTGASALVLSSGMWRVKAL